MNNKTRCIFGSAYASLPLAKSFAIENKGSLVSCVVLKYKLKQAVIGS